MGPKIFQFQPGSIFRIKSNAIEWVGRQNIEFADNFDLFFKMLMEMGPKKFQFQSRSIFRIKSNAIDWVWCQNDKFSQIFPNFRPFFPRFLIGVGEKMLFCQPSGQYSHLNWTRCQNDKFPNHFATQLPMEDRVKLVGKDRHFKPVRNFHSNPDPSIDPGVKITRNKNFQYLSSFLHQIHQIGSKTSFSPSPSIST